MIIFENSTDTALTEALQNQMEKVILLSLQDFPDSEVCVSFVSEKDIQVLNKDYRGIDRVTDVLSFQQYVGEELDAISKTKSQEPILLGDIVICLDVAKRQAENYGHSLERELCFLCVHGTLHLLGYDHEDNHGEESQEENENCEMFQLQERILKTAGVSR